MLNIAKVSNNRASIFSLDLGAVFSFIQIRTERNALIAIAVTWVVILLASVPVYLSHGEVKYTYSSAEHTACVFLEADRINRPDGFNKPVFQVR
jgi:allatostatin receptor